MKVSAHNVEAVSQTGGRASMEDARMTDWAGSCNAFIRCRRRLGKEGRDDEWTTEAVIPQLKRADLWDLGTFG